MQSDISASAPLISLGIFVTNAKEIADSILTVHSIYNACIVQDLKTFLAVVMKEARETCGGKAFASTLRNLRRYAFSIYIFSCGIILFRMIVYWQIKVVNCQCRIHVIIYLVILSFTNRQPYRCLFVILRALLLHRDMDMRCSRMFSPFDLPLRIRKNTASK